MTIAIKIYIMIPKKEVRLQRSKSPKLTSIRAHVLVPSSNVTGIEK